VWAGFGPASGRGQAGRRPAVVVSSRDYAEALDRLVIVVPCTRTDRRWPNHVLLTGPTGLSTTTFAMTEQPRTLSIERVHRVLGHVDDACLASIARWLRTWLVA
jgi:mRNA interferase MazF